MSEKIEEKLKKYRELTKKALAKVGIIDKEKGNELIEMARNYYNDAIHFEKEGKLLTALAAYSYAHAWIDAGVRLGFLDGKNDDQLFVLPK
ncbi:MAG TPA: DUF357 domain-containing protein [archaeon]|nr:DUF357 domain-containing protein [archaeon]